MSGARSPSPPLNCAADTTACTRAESSALYTPSTSRTGQLPIAAQSPWFVRRRSASLGAKLQSGLPQLVPPFLPLAVPESSCPQAQGPARPSSTRGGNLPNEVLHQTLNVCPLTGAVSKTAGKLGGTLQATSSRQWCINQKFLRWPEEPATSPSTHQRGRSRSPSGCSSAAAAEGAASRCQRVKPRCPSWKRRRPSCHGKGPWRKDLLAHHRLTAAIQRDKARRPSLHGYCHADPIDQAWLCM